MLILTRRIGEKLVVGNDVYLTVLRIQGNQIRLGIEAPKNISVNRYEVHLKIQHDQEKT